LVSIARFFQELDMNVIDLRSDTVTKPSEEMRKVMYEAEVGDDAYGEDPSVNRLEELAAVKLGKEAGLFVSSGTQGNLISLLTHIGRGEGAIVGSESHIYEHEQGGASTLGGIYLCLVPNQKDGTLSLNEIEDNIAPNDAHYARTNLVAFENTFNGIPISASYTKDFVDLTRKHGLKSHLDGARLFNACLANNCKPTELVAGIDSVQFCFSKGLGAPAGSMICGSETFIKEARRWRKALGGTMRQIGIIAAACEYALDKMIARLPEDHETARVLADKLEQLEGISVDWNRAKTNMVWINVNIDGISAAQLVEILAKEGLKAFNFGPKTIRMVTHYGITLKDIDTAGDIIQKSLKSCGKKPVGI
jgi:threonine aldolase